MLWRSLSLAVGPEVFSAHVVTLGNGFSFFSTPPGHMISKGRMPTRLDVHLVMDNPRRHYSRKYPFVLMVDPMELSRQCAQRLILFAVSPIKLGNEHSDRRARCRGDGSTITICAKHGVQ